MFNIMSFSGVTFFQISSFSQDYLVATGLIDASEERRVATLRTLLGTEGRRLLRVTEGNQSTIDGISQIMSVNFKTTKTRTYYHCELFNLRQKKGQSIREFAIELKQLLKNCQLGNAEPTIIQDLFIHKLQEQSMRKVLIARPPESLQLTIDQAQEMEAAQRMTTGRDLCENKGQTIQCSRCSGMHPFRGNCPAANHKCKICGGRRHFESACKKRNKRLLRVQEANLKYVWVRIDGKNLKLLADTGAEVNILSETSAKLLQQGGKRVDPNVVLRSYNGTKIPVLTEITKKVEYKKNSKTLKFLIVRKGENVLSHESLKALGVLKWDNESTHKKGNWKVSNRNKDKYVNYSYPPNEFGNTSLY